MSYKRNIAKEEWIERCGITAGLPLFENAKSIEQSAEKNQRNSLPYAISDVKLPDWIWTGTSIKAEVFHLMKDKFAEDSLLYLRAIIQLGGRATDHEVKEFFNDPEKWTAAIVSARRNYFVGDPYYLVKSYPGYKKPGPKGIPNVIWCVDFAKLYQLIIN